MTNEELKEAAQRYIANFNVNCAASFEIPDGAWVNFVAFVQQLEKNNDRQEKLVKWGTECFGAEHMADRKVRGLRLLEEAIEFCQSVDAPVEQCAKLVEHVYSRPPGDPKQELGGVGVGWFAAAAALGCNALDCLDVEIERVMSKPRSHFTQRNLQKNEAGFTGKPGQTQPWRCPQCGEDATHQTPDGTFWDSNAHHWRTGPTKAPNIDDVASYVALKLPQSIKLNSSDRSEAKSEIAHLMREAQAQAPTPATPDTWGRAVRLAERMWREFVDDSKIDIKKVAAICHIYLLLERDATLRTSAAESQEGAPTPPPDGADLASLTQNVSTSSKIDLAIPSTQLPPRINGLMSEDFDDSMELVSSKELSALREAAKSRPKRGKNVSV